MTGNIVQSWFNGSNQDSWYNEDPADRIMCDVKQTFSRYAHFQVHNFIVGYY